MREESAIGSPHEDVLRAALDLLCDRQASGVALLDGSGRVGLWSGGAARLTGWSEEDALGEPIGRLLSDEGDASGSPLRLVREALQTGAAAREYAFRRPDGVRARSHVSLRRLPGHAAHPWLVMLFEPAASESAPAAEARQVQKLEAVGRLAGGIAHDFNNLLTAIQGHAQLLLDDMPPGAAGRADLEEILAAGERATALTRQLLTFTRRQQVDPQEIDVNAVVINFQNMLRRLIPEHIELSFDLDPAAQLLIADVGHIEQILLNLAINGRDAMPGGGSLAIRTAAIDLRHEYAGRGGSVPAGRYVQIAVSDSGVGMTPDVQERIFEPFFTTKPEGKGTGLGLATVADIVRQYDGHLNVYTEPGRGTIFKVFLPAAGPAIADEPAPTDRGSESVLIVEDDPVVRALASRTLRGRGYRVLDADRGDDALTLADESGGVDIVVTDIVVPGMSGRKLAEHVRQRYPHTRVLYTSGFAVQDAVRQGLADHDANYLEKPFSPDRLARTVRETLDRSE